MTLAHDPGIAIDSRIHGGLDCADAEALFQDTLAEHESLKADAAVAEQIRADMLRDADIARQDRARLQSLLADLDRKLTAVCEERDALAAQNTMLLDEYAAAESVAIPEDALAHSVVTRPDMTALYRTASRVTRGPLPPSVLTAVADGHEEITTAMREAGLAALDKVIRREVRRRRRRATGATPRRGSTRRAR